MVIKQESFHKQSMQVKRKNVKKSLRILVLGATGMLGHAVYRVLSSNEKLITFGTARTKNLNQSFPKHLLKNLIYDTDVESYDSLITALEKAKPDVIINCIGVIKQLADAEDILKTVPLNTLLPHRLALLAKLYNSRLILVSTDCVFLGTKGNYRESDLPDCADIYGRSKLLGEISNNENVLTIRTSIIGHEIRGGLSLVDWFLSQNTPVFGYSNVIFSGLPTNELAEIIQSIILKQKHLSGLYHISANPINKYELLKLIGKIYKKKIKITELKKNKLNRSLNHSKFTHATGYKSKEWDELINSMHNFYFTILNNKQSS